MPISVIELARAAEPIFHVTTADIIGIRRLPEFFQARCAVAMAAKAAGRTDSEIARAMSGRKPCSITHARKRGEHMRGDPEFRAASEFLVKVAHVWAVAHTQELLSRHTVQTIKQEARRA
jgi:hypothetical protein